MFIRLVDDSLEHMLRAELPFPEEAGDVSFDVPSSAWAGSVTRPTVNLFLFDISRSSQPNRFTRRASAEDGRTERRKPQPMIELNYMISAWVGNDPRESHQLLGEVLSRFAARDALPAEYVAPELEAPILISFVEDDRHRARDIWNGANNSLQAGFSMHVTVPADTFGWTLEPRGVTMIQAGAAPTVPAGSD
ncbi:Pvc16 family protein [Jatrophihabitans fulvus]